MLPPLWRVAIFLLIANAPAALAPPVVASLWVTRSVKTAGCRTSDDSPWMDAQRELRKAGVRVLRAEKQADGVDCLPGHESVGRFEIPSDDLTKARALGFQPLRSPSTFP